LESSQLLFPENIYLSQAQANARDRCN